MIEWLDSGQGVRICVTLLHSVWQVALLVGVARLLDSLFQFARNRKVEWSYWTNVTALVVALIAMPITFLIIGDASTNGRIDSPAAQLAPVNGVPEISILDDSLVSDSGEGESSVAQSTASFSISDSSNDSTAIDPLPVGSKRFGQADIPWASISVWGVAAYLVGVVVMLTRLVISVARTNRLAQCGQRLNDGTAFQIVQRLCKAWSMDAMPALRLAEKIVMPKVVGLIRPSILLPASAITGLTMSELELILAHELAHVRRHDMWVNLLQRLAETVLFFNPALWVLSRQISKQREYCCDEIACSSAELATSDQGIRLHYAETLLRVVELARGSSERDGEVAALAASGRSPSELRHRVARLFGEPLREPLRLTRGGVLLVVGFAMLLIGPVLWSAKAESTKPADGVVGVVLGLEETESLVKQLEQQGATVFTTYRPTSNGQSKRLIGLDVWRASPEALRIVGRFEGLQTLSFVASDLRVPAFQEIGKLTSLKSLTIANGQLLPQQLKTIGKLTNLETLSAMFTVLDETSEDRQRWLGELTVAEQQLAERLRNDGKGEHVIEAVLLTDRSMPNLYGLTQLKDLEFLNTFASAGLVSIEPLTKLEKLHLDIVGPTPDSLASLQSMKNLRSLRYLNADDQMVAQLAKLNNLEELDIWSGDVTDASVAQLAKLVRLERLEIRGNQITDDGLELLLSLPRLQMLDLTYAKTISPGAIALFRNQKRECTVKTDQPEIALDAPTTVSGVIVHEDGSPAIAPGQMYSSLKMVNGNGYFGTENQFTNKFSVSTRAGTFWLTHFPEGHAPVWTEKMELKPGEVRSDLKLVIASGREQRIRVVDSNGESVAGAKLIADPVIHGSVHGPVFEKTTDADGEFVLQHLANTKYSFRVAASGYETLQESSVGLKSDQPITLTLVDAKKTTGVVLRQSDRQPLAGAKVYLKREINLKGPDRGFANSAPGFWGKQFATTDDQGRFSLDQLRVGSSYIAVVQAADGARSIVRDLRAGIELEILMSKRLDLVVNYKGDLGKLKKTRGKVTVKVRQRMQMVTETDRIGELFGDSVPLESTPGGGRAIFKGLAVDPDPDTGRQLVEVTLDYQLGLKKTVEINPDGPTEVDFELPLPPPQFPTATSPSLHGKDQSAKWFKSEDHVHFAVFYPGFFQDGFQLKTRFDTQDSAALWDFSGGVVLHNSAGEKHRVPISFENLSPGLRLSIAGRAYDLSQGRVFVLDFTGNVQQLDIDPLNFTHKSKETDQSLAILKQQIKKIVDGSVDTDPKQSPDNPNAFLIAKVVDAESGNPIRNFTALAGVNRMEDLGWQWQTHTIHQYQDGELQWPPLKLRGYKKQVIRVDAAGYLPHETPLLMKLEKDDVAKPGGATTGANGESIPNVLQGKKGQPANYTIRLKRDAGVTGRIVDPQGNPLEGVTVAIATGNHRGVRLNNKRLVFPEVKPDDKLRDRWEQPKRAVSDADGRFQLPTETSPHLIVAASDLGVAVVTQAEFQVSPELKLRPWGKIEGQIQWGDTSAEGEKIHMSAYGGRSHSGHPFWVVSQDATATVDKEGRFTFNNVAPGWVQLGRESNPPGEWSGMSLKPIWHVDVSPGETLNYVVGGKGRPVTGKVEGFKNWKNVRVSMQVVLNYPRLGFMANPKDPTWPAFNAYQKSPAYLFFNKSEVEIAADGTFRIENVAAEKYQIVALEKDDEAFVQQGATKLVVGPMPDGTSDEALESSIIKMAPMPRPKLESKKSENESAEAPKVDRFNSPSADKESTGN